MSASGDFRDRRGGRQSCDDRGFRDDRDDQVFPARNDRHLSRAMIAAVSGPGKNYSSTDDVSPNGNEPLLESAQRADCDGGVTTPSGLIDIVASSLAMAGQLIPRPTSAAQAVARAGRALMREA